MPHLLHLSQRPKTYLCGLMNPLRSRARHSLKLLSPLVRTTALSPSCVRHGRGTRLLKPERACSTYHPSTVSLDSWQKSNPNSAPSLFYWQGEEVNGATLVMHFQMSKRAYEQMLALVAGSELRVRPSTSK
jgi:hypothetical protein